MIRFSTKRPWNGSQPPTAQAHPSPCAGSGSKRRSFAALFVGTAVVCASLAMAASWDSADARGKHGARSHGSVARASGGFFGHRAASGRDHGGYKAQLRHARPGAHHRPDRIRRLNPDAGRGADKVRAELRPINKADKVQDELRPIRKFKHHSPEGIRRALKAGERRAFDRLSGAEKEKIFERARRQQQEAQARAEANRRSQDEAQRRCDQYNEAEHRNRDIFQGAVRGGASSDGLKVRCNP